jgi:coiled-coil domain-containing protein 12
MSTSHASLDAAAAERKAHLASLRSKFLKRKAPTAEDEEEPAVNEETTESDVPNVTKLYLSGRNYDAESKGPKLGFESAPSEAIETLEDRTDVILAETKAQQEADAEEDKPLDLFSLQPKKPNWDLKREVEQKLKVLNTRTDNAIAKLVRDRIKATQKAEGDGAVGMEGVSLVEGVHMREKEEEDNSEDED